MVAAAWRFWGGMAVHAAVWPFLFEAVRDGGTVAAVLSVAGVVGMAGLVYLLGQVWLAAGLLAGYAALSLVSGGECTGLTAASGTYGGVSGLLYLAFIVVGTVAGGIATAVYHFLKERR